MQGKTTNRTIMCEEQTRVVRGGHRQNNYVRRINESDVRGGHRPLPLLRSALLRSLHSLLQSSAGKAVAKDQSTSNQTVSRLGKQK